MNDFDTGFDLDELDLESEQADIQEGDTEQPREAESLDDSIAAVMEELEANEASNELQGDKSKKKSKSVDKSLSEAGRKLNSAKKKKQVREQSTLEAEPGIEGEGSVEQELQQETQRLTPPARWSVEKKEWFLKQPREVQEEVSKGWGEIEAHSTKLWQDLNREKSQYEDVNRVVNHYLPQWNIRGMTPAQAISELCAVQDIFAKQGPIAGCLTVMQKNGVSPEALLQHLQGGGQQPIMQQNPYIPAQQSLTEEKVLQLLDSRTAQLQQQQVVSQAEAEFRAVQNEVTPDGRYAYPELHDVNYIERAKPFVSDLRKTQPGIPWGEAFKRAVNTLRVLDGKSIGSPSAATSPKLPNSDIQRIKSASVSVRGRGNPSVANNGLARKGESIEESARAILEEFNSL